MNSSQEMASAMEDRIQHYKNLVFNNRKSGKHTVVLNGVNGVVLHECLRSSITIVRKKNNNCDFHIVVLIRFLYLVDVKEFPHLATIIDEIEDALTKFPFWPAANSSSSFPEGLVFWSENHILLLLSSRYLMQQRLLQRSMSALDASATLALDLETRLLVCYLEAHCSKAFNNGAMYETLSHTYLPHSMAALMNIFDFCLDECMKKYALTLINCIVIQFLYCYTLGNGVCNLTASARAYPRTRLRNFSHNVNQLMNFIVGYSPDALNPAAISDFIATTRWRPTADLYSALYIERLHQLPMSPSTEPYHNFSSPAHIYQGIDQQELAPFYWSAGLVLHPSFAKTTSRYLARKNIGHNVQLWPLWWLQSNLESAAESFKHFTKGQVYTGIYLNVFKHSERGLCLSSFERFNPHKCGFQQMPWMAAVDGLPVWTQSGFGSTGIAGFGITNTHNPCVQQRGSLAVVTYLAPSELTAATKMSAYVFSPAVSMFWPEMMFDEHVFVRHPECRRSRNGAMQFDASSQPEYIASKRNGVGAAVNNLAAFTWCVGRRGQCVIAVMCTRRTKMNRSGGAGAELEQQQPKQQQQQQQTQQQQQQQNNTQPCEELRAEKRQQRQQKRRLKRGGCNDSTPGNDDGGSGGTQNDNHQQPQQPQQRGKGSSMKDGNDDDEEDEDSNKAEVSDDCFYDGQPSLKEQSDEAASDVAAYSIPPVGSLSSTSVAEVTAADACCKDAPPVAAFSVADATTCPADLPHKHPIRANSIQGMESEDCTDTAAITSGGVLTRCICEEYRHSWIVLVGTVISAATGAGAIISSPKLHQKDKDAATSAGRSLNPGAAKGNGRRSEYRSLHEFVEMRCLQLCVTEDGGGSAVRSNGVWSALFGGSGGGGRSVDVQYQINVIDTEEDSIAYPDEHV